VAGTGACGWLSELTETSTMVEVTVDGTLLRAEDGAGVEITVDNGQVVTVVRVRV